MTYAIGFDPDTHNAAWAAVGTSGILRVGLFRGKDATEVAQTIGAYEGFEASAAPPTVVIENQTAYLVGENKATPRDLIELSFVAGAFVAHFPRSTVYRPRPAAWKGQVPKDVHQRRILDGLGLRSTVKGTGRNAYCIPDDPSHISGSQTLDPKDWKHVVDAIGLAVWGLAEAKKQAEMARFRAMA